MNDQNRYSRVNKFEKRRKNTKAISILVIIGSSLLVLLIGIMLVSGKNDTSTKEDNSHKLGLDERNENEEDHNDNNSNNMESSAHDDFVSGQEESNDPTTEESDNHSNSSTDDDESNLEKDQDESNGISTETAESTDDNIIEVLTENWEPVGTIQEGAHTIDYNNGTQDRIEMNKAVSVATGLSEENIETWWVGNNGDQKVRLTVSDRGENEIYRVYLSWIDNNGWQPTKVERLKENDAK